MIVLTQVILFSLALVAVVLGWNWGVRKGAIAYLITLFVFSLIALIFSGLWIIPIALWLPFALLAGGLGLASGVKFRQGKKLIAIALFSPLFAYWSGLTVIEIKKENELQQVSDFVLSNKTVIQTAGENIAVHHPGGWMKPKGFLPFRYELPISGSNNIKGFYVFVDVSRSWMLGNPLFSVACVTTLSVGARDPRIDVCKQ